MNTYYSTSNESIQTLWVPHSNILIHFWSIDELCSDKHPKRIDSHISVSPVIVVKDSSSYSTCSLHQQLSKARSVQARMLIYLVDDYQQPYWKDDRVLLHIQLSKSFSLLNTTLQSTLEGLLPSRFNNDDWIENETSHIPHRHESGKRKDIRTYSCVLSELPSILMKFVLLKKVGEYIYSRTSMNELRVIYVMISWIGILMKSTAIMFLTTPILLVTGILLLFFIAEQMELGFYRYRKKQYIELPLQFYKKREMRPVDRCPICWDDFIEDIPIRILPCRHYFHTTCVDPWLTEQSTSCPTCKQDVFSD
jgi:hypothetical protein